MLGRASALLRERSTRQLVALYGALSLSMVVGIAVSVLNARVLGVEAYGDLRFLQTAFTITITCLTFGYFVTGSRLLAKVDRGESERGLTGALLFMSALVGIAMILAVVVFSFAEGAVFGGGLGPVIRLCAPLTFAYALQVCLDNVLQGTNRIYGLSALRIAPPALYLVVAGIVSSQVDLTLTQVLFTHLATLALVTLGIAAFLRPDFRAVKSWLPAIQRENRSYGVHVYVGFLTGVASSHLGVLAVGYFLGSAEVAHFALAVTLTLPLSIMPNVAGTTFFRAFAQQERIDPRLERGTWLLTALAVVVFGLLIELVVDGLYSTDYAPVVTIARWIALGAAFHGLGDFYNRFAGAHGKGRLIRNSNFAVGGTNVVGNVVLVSMFGVSGAVATRVAAGLVYFAIMRGWYGRVVGAQTPSSP